LTCRPKPIKVRATWKLLPLASNTIMSRWVLCFSVHLANCDMGTLLKSFSTTAAKGVGPQTSAAVKLSG
jgi:hypothetical protein